MTVTLLSPNDERWGEVLQTLPHEFYHWPRYAALEAERIGGEGVALVVEGEGNMFFLPLIQRPIAPAITGDSKAPAIDAVSPYGYPGPLTKASGGGRDAFIDEALDAAQPILRQAGWVSIFVRTNPILNRSDDCKSHGSLVEHGACVWLDLTLSSEQLHSQTRPRYRSYINGASRAGVVARFDEQWHHLGDFVRLYYQTMDKVGAERWYYFDRPYFEGLRQVLGDHLKLCIVEFQGRVVAAGLFAVSGGIVQYLFSGSDETGGQPHATKLMLVFVRDWAKAAGQKVLHLGGGLGGRADDLLTFKQGFSKLSHPFYSWRWIIDESRYAGLTDRWERIEGAKAAPLIGYFPAYRKAFSTGTPHAVAE